MVTLEQVLQFVVFFVFFIWVLLRSTTTSDKDLPKYDTQMRILTVYFLLLLFLILITTASVRLGSYALGAEKTPSMLLSVVFVLPVPLALLAYAMIGYMIARAYRTDPAYRSVELLDVSRQITEACEQHSIIRPQILVSQIPFLPPQVFGSLTKAYLILPRNYKDILDSLDSKVGSDTGRALHTFVVNHELTHLKNRDYRLFTWLASYLRLLVKIWFPICLSALLVKLIDTKDVSLFPALYFSALLPLLNVGLLYLLALSLIRDRELLADHHSLQRLSYNSRTQILQNSVKLGTEMISPLALLFRMFPARHSPLLGLSLSSAEALYPSRTSKKTLIRISHFVVRLLQPFIDTHPTEELRIKSLTSKSDPLLSRQGEKENGIFIGLAVGLLLSYWGFGTRAFASQPTNEYFFISLLVASGILAASVFLPVRHINALQVPFEEYDRIARRKLAYAGACIGLLMMLVALPVINKGEFFLLLRTGIFVAMGAYVFWLLVFMLAVASGKLAFPQTRTLWRVGIRVMIGLFIMALFFG